MSDIMPRVGRKIVVDESQTGLLPLLNIQAGGLKP
jgi:hypothetical protein